MSATYNWAYKPGVANKYGFTVPTGADDVRPAGWCYVALFGNDNSGNGSRQKPYRTLIKAITTVGSGASYVFASGVWREDTFNQVPASLLYSSRFIGDGDVKIDYSYYGRMVISGNTSPELYNMTIIGSGLSFSNNAAGFGGAIAADCTFRFTVLAQLNGNITNIEGNTFTNCIFENYADTWSITASATFNNCTFYNMSNLQLQAASINSCIFFKCNISVISSYSVLSPRYSLFYQCNWRFNTTIGTPGGTYPVTPSGFTYYSTMSAINTAYITAFPTSPSQFPNCIVADPLFNNSAIGDYTLDFSSPAKNLSYFGTYVGARSIAQVLKIRAIEADGDFDFLSTVNCTIVDGSITLTDSNIDAIIETKVIENTLGRQLKSIPIVGFNADRNGQYIDSITDLATITKSPSDTLVVPASYLVETGAIIYNSVIYTPGQRFTTVMGQIAFTTTSSGVLREILEAPQRHTIEMKLSDVQPFTIEAFNHFEPGIAPTTNNIGDSRTGAILRGNGDPAYVRGSTIEFPVNSKYIKIRFTIRANNLKP